MVPFPTVQAVTDGRGDYQTSAAGSRISISIDTVTAHYAGRTALAAAPGKRFLIFLKVCSRSLKSIIWGTNRYYVCGGMAI